MKKVIVTLFILVVATSLCAKGSSDSDVSEDIAAIESIWNQYSQFKMAGDADAWLALHDSEALKMPQDRPLFNPWEISEAIKKSWKKSDAESVTEMAIYPEETIILGNYAYSRGNYSKIVTPKNGGEVSEFHGKFLTILKKNGNGEWLIFRDSYSSNG